MNEIFTKKEFKVLVISVLLLGLIFGLNDHQEKFNLDFWLLNLIKVFIVVFVSLMFRELIRKFIAHKYGCEARIDIWKFQRYGISPDAKLPMNFMGFKVINKIWAGIIIPLIVSLASLGKLYFPAINTTEITEDYNRRVGKDFLRLTGSENAIINLSAAFASLFLGLMGVIFNLNQFVTVNLWICLFSFLPLGNLDGTKTLFGSWYWYLFGLIFSVLAFVLINYLFIVDVFILSLMGAGISVLILLYFTFR